MEREILFRAQKVDNNEWIEGYYAYLFDVEYNPQGYDDVPDRKHYIMTDNSGYYEVNPETVSQFTGMLDKNGTKIFEGDIIFNETKTLITCKDDPRTYLVEWKDGEYGCNNNSDVVWLKQKPSFEFKKINPEGKNYMSLIFSQDKISVVGNFYENPELLR